MEIAINLTPELVEQLRKKAIHRGQDISIVASELLASVLEWETQDSEEAIKGIQQGLEDFDAGNFRSLNEFAEEQRRK
ncbi:hypothetical protein QM565_17760 [Geitlerinema splendidum]|nr:hypothetical protein [Geitlerinema splendidum]